MSIFTKLKTATDFSASVIKEGFALIWPEKKSDGSVALQVKLEDGSVQEIGGGSAGDIDAKIATHNSDPAAHPDKLPLSGGQMTGGLKINATNALRINNGDYGVFLRKDASAFYIMVTAQGDPDGTYTDARPLKIDLATGECYINGGATKDSLGNVITTTYARLNNPTFSNGIEITGTTPFIDFHYNNSESDYTFRIVQNSEDTLTLSGKVNVSNTLAVTSGEIQSATIQSYRIVYGDYGTFWRNDGRNLYLMITNSGDQYGQYNSFRPISVNLSTGQCDISGAAIITESKLSGFKSELNACGLYPKTVGKTDGGFDGRLEQGNYWYNNAIHVGNPIGDMSYCSGMLYVHNVDDVNRSQIFHCITDYGLYYRWYYGDTWRPWFKALTNDDVKHVVGTTDTNVKQNDYIIIANTLIVYFGYTWVDRAGSVTVYLPVVSSAAVSAVATCTNPQTSAITNLKCYTQRSSIEIVIDSTTTTTQTTVNWIAIGYLA